MESYRLIKKLDSSQDCDKDMAIKYDAGKIKNDKYGEATISGHFLFATRSGKYPPMYVKQIEEKAYIWLNEMGLDDCVDYAINKLNLPSMVGLTLPGVNPEKMDVYFKFGLFLFAFDDGVIKLIELNKNNLIKQRKDIMNLTENLISIIESGGNDDATEAAASKLNPVFHSTCKVLSSICSSSFKQMSKDEYKYFAREVLDYMRVNKWMQEYYNSPYSKIEYYLLRRIDGAVNPTLFIMCLAKDIRISNTIKMHPIFQRYYNNVSMHVDLVNDILSLQKEIDDNEKLNLVLVNCQKHSLQRSIYKAEKAANEIIINLKKDKSRLKSYFPTDESLKKFIDLAEYAVDGFINWHLSTNRYKNLKSETYVVEYNCHYDNWLEQIGLTNTENMEEPEFISELNK